VPLRNPRKSPTGSGDVHLAAASEDALNPDEVWSIDCGLSGLLGYLEGYSIWRSTLSKTKLSIVRSNIFACECGI